MPRDDVEVGVSVQQHAAGSDRDGRDEAIREAADGVAGAAAGAVDAGRSFVVRGLVERKEAAAAEQLRQDASVPVVSRSREHLEQHDARRGQRLVGGECSLQATVLSAPRRP